MPDNVSPGSQGTLAIDLDTMRENLSHPQKALERIGEEVVLPAFGRNYESAGLKKRSGVLFRGLTKRGAQGNVFDVRGNSLEVGIDYETIPYARFVIEGRGPVTAKRAKALRFTVDGQTIFRKRVGPSKPHDIIRLDTQDEAKAQEIAFEELGKDWQVTQR